MVDEGELMEDEIPLRVSAAFCTLSPAERIHSKTAISQSHSPLSVYSDLHDNTTLAPDVEQALRGDPLPERQLLFTGCSETSSRNCDSLFKYTTAVLGND